MAEKTDNWIYDGIGTVHLGMDSGTLPRLLPPGKAAFSFNATFRGGFPTDRPKYRKINLTFDSVDIQTAFESGLFQGAGYYRSQSGVGSIMVSLSGRILQLIPDAADGATTVERTIPGDPNLATQPQAWFWQSELWGILTDGNSLPIFIDDNTARRSLGPSYVVGTVAGGGFVAPAIGSNVTVTLAANYTGPLNVVVAVDSGTHAGATYIVIAIGAPGGGTGYEAKLENNNFNAPGTVLPIGTPIVKYSLGGSYIIGNLVVPFTVPALGSSASAFLDALYTGPANTLVTINNWQYKISPVAQSPPTASTTIVLQNLSDSSTGGTVLAGIILRTIGELGIGRMGAYVQSRNWMSLIDGVSFTASDLVGESSGSSAYNFRDAVLKVSKNEALTAGKPFRIPSAGDTIQGMSDTAQLDASQGQGPLAVLTDTNAFSCLAPVDSSTWATLKTPILPKTLIGSGTTSHESISLSSGDLLFRSPDGLRSLLIARLDFNRWGNTPISYELKRVIELDDQNLLNRCSSVVFDNRLLMTCNPVQGPQGVYHRGLLVMNFDELSSLQDKAPAVYDGLWTGLQILRLIKAPLKGFSGETRQFALCYSSVNNKNELWEILPDGVAVADELSPETVCTGTPDDTNQSPAPDNLTMWLDGGYNWTDATWTDRSGAIPFSSNGLGIAAFTTPNLINVANLAGPVRTYTGTVNNASVIFFQYSFLSPLNACILLTIGGAALFKIEFVTAGGTIRVTTGGVDILNVSGLTHRPKEYIIQVSTDPIGGTILTVYDAETLSVIGTASMAAGVDLTGSQTVVLSNSTPNIFAALYTRGLLTYSALPTGEDLTATLNYLSSLMFGRFNVPRVCAPATVRPIWAIESPDLFRGSKGELISQFKALEGGELSVDDVQGDVDIQVFYKPDQYPGWILWHKWSISVDMSAIDAKPGYFPRMGLGRPKSTDENAATGQITRFGYTFQTRTVIQGHCRLLGSKYAASRQAEPGVKTPIDGDKHIAIATPTIDDFVIYNIDAGITSLPP